MDKTIYSEDSISFQPISEYEEREFILIRRSKKRKKYNRSRRIPPFDYKQKLFSSDTRPFIMLANGIQTNVSKGSEQESQFWCVKDSASRDGHFYYFASPDEAERIFNIHYHSHLKQMWHENSISYRYQSDEENDTHSVTMVK